MKFLKNKTLALILLTISIAFIGCQSENDEIQNETNIAKSSKIEDVKTIDNLLINIKPDLQSRLSKADEFEYITFEVVKNFDNGKISIENIQNKKFFPIADESHYQNKKDAYQVDCDLPGDDNDWSDTCDGKWSCGGLIYDCLEAGGCATICNNERNANGGNFGSVKVLYIPKK